jgi:hypothetical protein
LENPRIRRKRACKMVGTSQVLRRSWAKVFSAMLILIFATGEVTRMMSLSKITRRVPLRTVDIAVTVHTSLSCSLRPDHESKMKSFQFCKYYLEYYRLRLEFGIEMLLSRPYRARRPWKKVSLLKALSKPSNDSSFPFTTTSLADRNGLRRTDIRKLIFEIVQLRLEAAAGKMGSM